MSISKAFEAVRARRLLIGLALGAFALSAGTAAAQQSTILPKQFEAVDQNGVSLLGNGFKISAKEPSIAIGDPSRGGLVWQRSHDAGVNVSQPARHHSLEGVLAYCDTVVDPPAPPTYVASVGESSDTFQFALTGAYSSNQFSGATLLLNSPAGEHTYKRGDGSVVKYDATKSVATNCGGGWPIKSLTKPDGEVITWNYYSLPSGTYAGLPRLQSVTNNLGYQIHIQYVRDTATTLAEFVDWNVFAKVTAVDNALNACGAVAFTCPDSVGANWPYLAYSFEASNATAVVTDRLGAAYRFAYNGDVRTINQYPALTSVTSPQSTSVDLSLSYTASGFTLTGARGAWTYAVAGPVTGGVQSNVTGPNGYSRQFVFSDPAATPVPYQIVFSLPLSDTLNGRTTTFQYETINGWVAGRLIRMTGPDGDIAEYEYDARRNVKHVRQIPKPGSGIAEIHTYADYPEPTSIICVTFVTCNKPNWVTVPGPASGTPSSLPKTTFTYNSTHGGVVTETKPAPGSGALATIQPQTRYTYNATGGITRVATEKSCKTTASCAGTADETSVETTYNTKRMPSQVVTRAGNNTTAGTSTYSTVLMTYSPQGDVESTDGPLSGTVDKVWGFYDVMRRPRVTVGPDPDGAGSLVYRATRTSFDADGNPTTVEQGSVTAPANCSAANSFCSTTMTVLAKSTTVYDGFGRKIRRDALNNGTGLPDAVTQYSYDSAGLVECVATRMNSAVYGALPGACTQSPAGSFGQDRIVRTTYKAWGDPFEIQSGYGTGLVRTERTFVYLAPGQVSTVKDANNNLTTYTYDGFNRLKQTQYPVPTLGGNASSTSDFEELLYDGSGRVASERRRDGLTVLNTYDNLDRLTLINRPGAELDVTNGYDNFDNLVSASQTGASVTWTYDALGRVLTEIQPNGTVSSTYDTAGRRTQLTYPGAGFFTNHQYYDDGRLKLIGLNGATTGANVLATFYDDQLGRRGSVCRGTGSATSCSSVARTAYGYDTLSRLTSLAQDLTTGTAANDVTWTLGYSPASQLVSRAASSSTYEWPATQTFTDSYGVNGLNQYTAVAGLALAYDGRGNTTNDTTKTYGYDSSNRLVSASNGAGAVYDPTGRLLSITQGATTTKFLYDGTRLIAEYNGSGTLLRRYVHGDGVDDPIVWYDSSGTTNKRNLFKDERGSVIASDTGTAVTTIKYDEYGNATTSGSAVPRFQYTGQTWISELGLNYYKARFYSPDLGRFMQTDPIGTADLMNLYAYVGNDPINGTDPSGEMGDDCTAKPGGDCVTVEAGCDTKCRANKESDRLFFQVLGFLFQQSLPDPTDPMSYATLGRVKLKFADGMKDRNNLLNLIKRWRCGCFAQGTLVLTPSGLVPIETISVGDWVVAWNEETNRPEDSRVVELLRPDARPLWQVSLRATSGSVEEIFSTDDHPWLLEDLGWVTTNHLRVGDKIRTTENEPLVVEAVEVTSRVEGTYNLTIEKLHTFVVGAGHAVVHNASKCAISIANGHAFEKHVVQRGEFPGVRTRQEFADLVDDTVNNATNIKNLSNGRTAFWRNGVLVIVDPKHIDGGTMFVPKSGFSYFQGLN